MRKSFTDLRKSILEEIEKEQLPVTVQQLREKFPGHDLSTLYRGIKFLEKEGLIESLTLNCHEDENARFYFLSGREHAHFIHCESCHRFTRIEECMVDGYEKEIEERYGIRIHKHLLLFTGLCRKCAG